MGGTTKIVEIIGGYTGITALMSINEHLNLTYDIPTLTSVFAVAGRPVISTYIPNSKKTGDGTRRKLATPSEEPSEAVTIHEVKVDYAPDAAPQDSYEHRTDDQDGAIILQTGQLQLVVPKDVQYDDVLDMLIELKGIASRLLRLGVKPVVISEK